MVAARQKFQIKHHESLPRQEGSTFPALEHSPSLGSDTSVASVRSSSWAATVGGVRPQFRVQHHPTTGKGRFVSLSHELPLPREHTSPGGRPPLLSGQTTAVNKSTPLVVIDGSNVAFAHRVDIFNPLWSPQGILLSLRVSTVQAFCLQCSGVLGSTRSLSNVLLRPWLQFQAFVISESEEYEFHIWNNPRCGIWDTDYLTAAMGTPRASVFCFVGHFTVLLCI